VPALPPYINLHQLRAHLRAVSRPAARKKSGSSARLSPAPHTRVRGLQEAGRSAGLWLRLLENRRWVMFGNYAAPQARGVD
jgi:hypothetical protein